MSDYFYNDETIKILDAILNLIHKSDNNQRHFNQNLWQNLRTELEQPIELHHMPYYFDILSSRNLISFNSDKDKYSIAANRIDIAHFLYNGGFMMESQKIKAEKENVKVKEQRENEIKNLQLQELQVKVKYLEKQFDEQSKFWKSGLKRDKRQYWQWFVTAVIALISLGLTLYFNFFK